MVEFRLLDVVDFLYNNAENKSLYLEQYAIMIGANIRWIAFGSLATFAIYWLSNLLLWYPWSISETTGMIVMLTVNPVLWGYTSYICLVKYPHKNLVTGVLLNSLIFTGEAIISDFIFFGFFRKSLDKLMHPTTFYGLVFILLVPFLLHFLSRKRIEQHKKVLTQTDFIVAAIIGFVCFGAVMSILIFDIHFS